MKRKTSPGFAEQPASNRFKKAPKKRVALRPLRTGSDYDGALAEYQTYFDDEPLPDTEEADRFELLGLLLAKYEEERYPLAPEDPHEALTDVMEAKGKSQADLAALIGASRASEILRRKRSLSLEHIRKIRSVWGVPADVLI
jgi:HTH-type transcriptional regulator/antitoxin HigA